MYPRGRLSGERRKREVNCFSLHQAINSAKHFSFTFLICKQRWFLFPICELLAGEGQTSASARVHGDLVDGPPPPTPQAAGERLRLPPETGCLPPALRVSGPWVRAVFSRRCQGFISRRNCSFHRARRLRLPCISVGEENVYLTSAFLAEKSNAKYAIRSVSSMPMRSYTICPAARRGAERRSFL